MVLVQQSEREIEEMYVDYWLLNTMPIASRQKSSPASSSVNVSDET